MDAPVDLTVAKDVYSSAFAELVGPTSDAAITLDRPVTIAVTLIDRSGRPVTGCDVQCSPAFQPGMPRVDPILRIREPRELREAADHPGRYEGQVAPGYWRVRVDGRIGDSSDIKVVSVEGTAHFEIHFE